MTEALESSSAARHDGAVSAKLALSDPEALGFSAERLEHLDRRLRNEIDRGSVAALSVLVARHGSPVFLRTFGPHALGSDASLEEDAIFRIASMTKPITGAALMILYEEGSWQLDDPVEHYLPELADRSVLLSNGELEAADHPMTMRELITSTAGIGASGGGGDDPSPIAEVNRLYAGAGLHAGTLNDMVERLAGLPLASQPGTRFQYGYSHDLQGLIVERIAGQPFDVVLRDRLFEPLGMRSTGFGISPSERSRLVPLYGYDSRLRLVESTFRWPWGIPNGESPQYFSGGGGLYSTLTDYFSFARMLASGGRSDGAWILSPPSIALMTSDLMPHGVPLFFASPLVGLGYGVGVGIVLDPGRASHNSGPVGAGTYFWSGAHGSWFWNDPVNDVTVIGMVNQELAALVHMGLPHPAPDWRAMTRSLVYQALVRPDA